MSDIDLERYQDSSQGRASVRGRDVEVRQCDFPPDEDCSAENEARAMREAAHRRQLKARIQACMTQMEAVCPPVQRSAT